MNPFPSEEYNQGEHIGTAWVSSSPTQESGTSSKSQEVFLMDDQSNFPIKIERRVIHQIVCILKDKSIGVLKFTDGHHPPSNRKAISGAFQF